MVGGYKDKDWNQDCPGLSIPFTPPASPMFLPGDVFDGHRQQDDPASVPFLIPYAWGDIDPPPLRMVIGVSAFHRAFAALCGRAEWAIFLLVPAGPALDADDILVPEVVRLVNVPHDLHVAVTSMRERGAVEQGTVVVYKPHGLMTAWEAQFATALGAINSKCGCEVHWWPQGVHRPNDLRSPELTASSATLLERVVASPHSDVAWLGPQRYCWVPVAARDSSPHASP